MARIRTIKPDFFTSDDICALTPLARLLYIGLWCEADREGRLNWTPRVFKRRYLPDDDCDIDELCKQLLARDLVRIFGEVDEYAYIPTFSEHQHINPRETPSSIPSPDDASRRVPDASNLDLHAQGGRKEGKGKEGNGKDASLTRHMASELDDAWQPSDEDRSWAAKARPDLTPALLDAETERFRNHAKANNRTAHNWGPNWRNWVSKAPAATAPRTQSGGVDAPTVDRDSDVQWQARLKKYKRGGFWMEGDWGPRPESGRSRVPERILTQWESAQTEVH
jgi:hypothetical protein